MYIIFFLANKVRSANTKKKGNKYNLVCITLCICEVHHGHGLYTKTIFLLTSPAYQWIAYNTAWKLDMQVQKSECCKNTSAKLVYINAVGGDWCPHNKYIDQGNL